MIKLYDVFISTFLITCFVVNAVSTTICAIELVRANRLIERAIIIENNRAAEKLLETLNNE